MLTNSAQAAPGRPADRLRSAGSVAWSLVGFAVLVLMAALLLMVLRSIVVALVIALFLAIVFSPLVDRMARHGVCPGRPAQPWRRSSWSRWPRSRRGSSWRA